LKLDNELTVLIPMAGEGSRFALEGYEVPKPLIDVSGEPMIMKAIKSLPAAKNYIFICRKEHIIKYKLNDILNEISPKVNIIDIDFLTDGQASTCLLAEDYIHPEAQLIIGACDNGMSWDKSKMETIISNKSIDALVWTFRNNVTVKRNPKMYGWVNTIADDIIKNVSCKIPISGNPVRDHAIVGTFWFRRAKDFFDNTKEMIAENRKINNEFYVDEVINQFIKNDYKIKIFEILHYLCWGTPNDLKLFKYWESFFLEEY